MCPVTHFPKIIPEPPKGDPGDLRLLFAYIISEPEGA